MPKLGRVAPRDRGFVSSVIARSPCDEAIHSFFAAQWIASLIGRRFAPTRWLAMTVALFDN